MTNPRFDHRKADEGRIGQAAGEDQRTRRGSIQSQATRHHADDQRRRPQHQPRSGRACQQLRRQFRAMQMNERQGGQRNVDDVSIQRHGSVVRNPSGHAQGDTRRQAEHE